jgi:hypothetical protein
MSMSPVHVSAKQIIQSKWEADFEENFQSVSVETGLSIAQEALKKLGNTLRDPYLDPPTNLKPLSLSYSFDLTKPGQVSSIKTWAVTSAHLSPFNQWFSELKRPLILKETGYLAHYMDRVAMLAKITISSRFAKLVLSEDYESLRFKVSYSSHKDKGNAAITLSLFVADSALKVWSPGRGVRRLLNHRDVIRAEWQANVRENQSKVGKQIAKSIIDLIQIGLTKLTLVPLQFKYSFDLSRDGQASIIKNWAADKASLTPFNEWFSSLSGGRVSQKTLDFLQQQLCFVVENARNSISKKLAAVEDLGFSLDWVGSSDSCEANRYVLTISIWVELNAESML